MDQFSLENNVPNSYIMLSNMYSLILFPPSFSSYAKTTNVSSLSCCFPPISVKPCTFLFLIKTKKVKKGQRTTFCQFVVKLKAIMTSRMFWETPLNILYWCSKMAQTISHVNMFSMWLIEKSSCWARKHIYEVSLSV